MTGLYLSGYLKINPGPGQIIKARAKDNPMNLIERATILHYHRHREAMYSGTPRALGWKNDESQQTRYQVLLGIGNLDGCRILDPGCGYGDLLGFLNTHCNGIRYIGVEFVPEFLKVASQRYADNGKNRFYLGDFSKMVLPECDYVLASGVFGYKTCDRGYYLRCIENFFKTATRGVAFNMLDKEKFSGHPLLTGHDRDEIIKFCQSLCNGTRVINGYLEDDFTIIMEKQTKADAL